jgi:hypothetical protein
MSKLQAAVILTAVAPGILPGGWSLDILDSQTWVKGPWFYQAAAAPTMVW